MAQMQVSLRQVIKTCDHDGPASTLWRQSGPVAVQSRLCRRWQCMLESSSTRERGRKKNQVQSEVYVQGQ